MVRLLISSTLVSNPPLPRTSIGCSQNLFFPSIRKGMINLGIKDYAGLVDQISRCLRPGGMVIFVESDYRVRAEDKRILIPPNFYTVLPTKERPLLGGGSSRSAGTRSGRIPTVLTNWAVPTWLATLSKCIRAKGGNIDSATVGSSEHLCA